MVELLHKFSDYFYDEFYRKFKDVEIFQKIENNF